MRSARGIALSVLVVAAPVAAVLGAALLRTAPLSVPTFAAVRAGHRQSDARLLDRAGVPLQEIRVDAHVRRLAWTPLDAISPALGAAVVAAEDRRFREHRGVDWRALAGAAGGWLAGGRLRGASTITMQLVALLDRVGAARPGTTSPVRRDARAKWAEMRRAAALERGWSKDEILEAYLNEVTFRGDVEGVAAAAAVLFGKAPHGLSGAEACVLAALVRAPNAASATVAAHARALGRVVGVEAAAVDAAAARAAARDRRGAGIALAPHLARRVLRGGGLPTDVRSTVDAELQRVATASLRRQLLAVREGRVADGAVLVADNASGDVLAYVASSGDLSRARDVDAVVARRQPGSTLKPFLYALAFDRGLLTPASLVEDAPLELAVAGGLYRPGNYDDRFHGSVTARIALASSLNVPAVRTLRLVGGEAFTDRLRRLGFTGLGEAADFYGPALALGSAEVSLEELVNAYRTLANGGTWTPLRLVAVAPDAEVEVEVEADADGAALRAGAGRRVYGGRAAAAVAAILADREARSLTFGLESPLATPFWSAVKTGTSSDMRDNWAVGFSRRHTVGVWVGNASGAPMRNVSGVTGAAPVWAEVMTWLQSARSGTDEHPAPRADTVDAAADDVAAAAAPAALAPRIVAPVSGTRLAVDPDAPPARRRVAFLAEGARPGWRWRLDGADLGAAATTVLWPPVRGAHRLELVDRERRAADAVEFDVR